MTEHLYILLTADITDNLENETCLLDAPETYFMHRDERRYVLYEWPNAPHYRTLNSEDALFHLLKELENYPHEILHLPKNESGNIDLNDIFFDVFPETQEQNPILNGYLQVYAIFENREPIPVMVTTPISESTNHRTNSYPGNDALQLFPKDSKEYEKLQMAALSLNVLDARGTKYTVEDTYFDYGQDWKYTTLIANASDTSFSYQALTPRQQRALLECPNKNLYAWCEEFIKSKL